MGTAGYMSPEQVRGEKLDARTDIFSFGLVLYEMATGRRAFAGDTGAELHKAILQQAIIPARELNPALPGKLEQIIGGALEKNREARYQSASKIRSDLEAMQRTIDPRHKIRLPKLVTVATVLLFIVIGVFRFARRQPSSPAELPEIKLRQLTSNSGENAVGNGVISPDGRYLAYSDRFGIHLKSVESGETRTIPPPVDISRDKLDFEVGGWRPDSQSFLANACPLGGDTSFGTSHGCSVWSVSLAGGSPLKIRDEAIGESFSPDGSLLSFETNAGKIGDREIWVMRADGQQARKVFEVDDNSTIGGLTWSANGQRIVYSRQDGPDPANFYFVGGDLNGGPATKILPPFDPKMANSFMLLSDGRMIYRLDESGFKVKTCNLWQVQMDARFTRFVGQPRRLTNFAELCANATSATSDGKRLVVFEWKPQSNVFVADLQGVGERSSNPIRLTLDESWNHPLAWTADSAAILFSSSRLGMDAIFKQPLGRGAAEPLLVMRKSDGLAGACLSPDGSWVYYTTMSYEDGPPETTKIMRDPVMHTLPTQTSTLMRVSVQGGSPQLVLAAAIEEWPRCARSPSSLCALSLIHI